MRVVAAQRQIKQVLRQDAAATVEADRVDKHIASAADHAAGANLATGIAQVLQIQANRLLGLDLAALVVERGTRALQQEAGAGINAAALVVQGIGIGDQVAACHQLATIVRDAGGIDHHTAAPAQIAAGVGQCAASGDAGQATAVVDDAALGVVDPSGRGGQGIAGIELAAAIEQRAGDRNVQITAGAELAGLMIVQLAPCGDAEVATGLQIAADAADVFCNDHCIGAGTDRAVAIVQTAVHFHAQTAACARIGNRLHGTAGITEAVGTQGQRTTACLQQTVTVIDCAAGLHVQCPSRHRPGQIIEAGCAHACVACRRDGAALVVQGAAGTQGQLTLRQDASTAVAECSAAGHRQRAGASMLDAALRIFDAGSSDGQVLTVAGERAGGVVEGTPDNHAGRASAALHQTTADIAQASAIDAQLVSLQLPTHIVEAAIVDSADGLHGKRAAREQIAATVIEGTAAGQCHIAGGARGGAGQLQLTALRGEVAACQQCAGGSELTIGNQTEHASAAQAAVCVNASTHRTGDADLACTKAEIARCSGLPGVLDARALHIDRGPADSALLAYNRIADECELLTRDLAGYGQITFGSQVECAGCAQIAVLRQRAIGLCRERPCRCQAAIELQVATTDQCHIATLAAQLTTAAQLCCFHAQRIAADQIAPVIHRTAGADTKPLEPIGLTGLA